MYFFGYNLIWIKLLCMKIVLKFRANFVNDFIEQGHVILILIFIEFFITIMCWIVGMADRKTGFK